MKTFLHFLAYLIAGVSVAGAQTLPSAQESLVGDGGGSEKTSHQRFGGLVLDAETGQPIESRVRLCDRLGRWHLVESVGGTAVHYERDLPHLPESPEVHTTLSNAPFDATLPPGQYTIRVERGKAYIPYVGLITIDDQPLYHEIRLRRWINIASRRWYSGDTYVHRSIEELPNKYSWPWSLMIIPMMDVDLFELLNNHVWQTGFGFPQWTIDTISPSMQLQQDENGFTEWGWIDYGLQTYYALVNCGFRMRVTAGTASGVHPVPLGFGRVYVRLPDGFSYDDWIEGLNAGRSFVSTGPMLDLRFNEHGGFTTDIDVTVRREASFWTAVRCFEEHPEKRVRFAHTNPVYVDLAGSQVRPRKREIEYFISRFEEEIPKLRGVITEESLAEYQEALRIYQEIGMQTK